MTGITRRRSARAAPGQRGGGVRGPARYRLFGALGSGSAAAEVLLAALGVDHEWIDAAPWEKHSPGMAELRSINALAQVPTLVTPAGEVLSESAAILWTLAERHDSAWLPPPSTRARAACLRWLSFVAAQVYAAGGIADHPERWLRDPDAQAALGAGARRRIASAWRIVADEFHGSRAFLLGGAPTILDLYVANVSRWWGARRLLPRDRPRFMALIGRIEALDAVVPVWQRHGFTA